MTEDTITSLAQELRVSHNLARTAYLEADGELSKAREILKEMLPKYLFVKVKYVSINPDSGGGLILLCVEKKEHNFPVFKTIVEKSRRWIENVKVHWTPEILFCLFEDYFLEHHSGPELYDAEKLKSAVTSKLRPAGFQSLFDIWDRPKLEVIADPRGPEERRHPSTVLRSVFTQVLNDVLVEEVSVELDYDFYTSVQFERTKEGLEFAPPGSTYTSGVPKKEDREKFKINLKGRFVIDPVNGMPVQDLEVGDLVYCEIVDRTDIALSAARMIGAYKRGLWLPVRGRIVHLKEALADRRRFRLKLAPGVYVYVFSYAGLLVSSGELTPRERVLQATEETQPGGQLALVVGLVLLAILVMTLLILR